MSEKDKMSPVQKGFTHEQVVSPVSNAAKVGLVALGEPTTVYWVDLKKGRILGPDKVLAVLVSIPSSADNIDSSLLSKGTFFLLESYALSSERNLWVSGKSCFFDKNSAASYLLSSST